MARRGYAVDEVTPIRFSFEPTPRTVEGNVARLRSIQPRFGVRNVMWLQVSDDMCEIHVVNARTLEEVRENIAFIRDGVPGLWYKTC